MKLCECLSEVEAVRHLDLQKEELKHVAITLVDGTEVTGNLVANKQREGRLVLLKESKTYSVSFDVVESVKLLSENAPTDTHDKTIAFDFDGVLAKYKSGQYPEIGEPVDGMKEFLDQLKEEGWKVIIFTCRGASEVEPWLAQHGFSYDYINENPDMPTVSPKIAADIYVDDRGVCFTGDIESLKQTVEDFEPWGNKDVDSEEDVEEDSTEEETEND